MSSTRLGLLTGPLAFAAIILGLATDTLPGGEVTDAQLSTYLDNHGYGVFLTMGGGVGLAGVLLLIFTSVLATRLEHAGAGPTAVRIVTAAGTGWAAMTMLAGAAWIGPFVAHVAFTKTPPTAQSNLIMSGFGYSALTLFAGLSAAIVAATVTAVALRSDMLPRWLAIVGVPATLPDPGQPRAPHGGHDPVVHRRDGIPDQENPLNHPCPPPDVTRDGLTARHRPVAWRRRTDARRAPRNGAQFLEPADEPRHTAASDLPRIPDPSLLGPVSVSGGRTGRYFPLVDGPVG